MGRAGVVCAVFAATGIVSTIANQIIMYQGAGDERTMLYPCINFIAMALVGLVPAKFVGNDAPKPKFDTLSEADKKVAKQYSIKTFAVMAVGLEIVGQTLIQISILLAGSGIFQVVYASVVCWAALLSWMVSGKQMTRQQWTGVTLVSIGLAISALGNAGTKEDTHNLHLLAGIGSSFLSAIVMAANYVFIDKVMTLPRAPTPQMFCTDVGLGGATITVIYMLFCTLQHWHSWVEVPMHEAHGSGGVAIIAYGVLAVSQVAHMLTLYMGLTLVGPVTLGLLNSVRAIGVYFLSAVMFCSVQPSQCFSIARALSAIVVTGGVSVYVLGDEGGPKKRTVSTHAKAVVEVDEVAGDPDAREEDGFVERRIATATETHEAVGMLVPTDVGIAGDPVDELVTITSSSASSGVQQ